MTLQKKTLFWWSEVETWSATYNTYHGTLESAMNSAGAFNPMYSVTETTPYTISSTGLTIRNGGHCSITAISNIMRYWRAMCCPNFPATYEQTFTAVFNKAIQMGYFSNVYDGSGYRNNYYDEFSFVKFYDGHTGADNGKSYVCWDMLNYYAVDNADGPKIQRHMFTLSPY